MKLLIITRELPFPRNKSGTTNTLYYLIKEWLKEFSLDIIYYGSLDHEAEIALRVEGGNAYHRDIESDIMVPCEKIGGKCRIKTRNTSYFRYSRCKPINANDYELVIIVGFESIFLFEYLEVMNSCKTIFFELDCLSLFYRRCTQYNRVLYKKIYYYLQYKLTKKIESDYYEKVSKILFVSESDKIYCVDNFKKIEKSKFQSIRNGVEPYTAIHYPRCQNADVFRIGFSGIYDYSPNNDAALFILKEIAEELFALRSDIVIHIVGKNPSRDIISYKKRFHEKLYITGYVEDINAYIADFDIYVSPLFIGTGMKNKILEAMNLGIPVVCTSISIEGINEMEDGKTCIVCNENDGRTWAEKISYLLNNKSMRNSFSEKTQMIINNRYRWKSIAHEFIEKSFQ